MLYKRITLYLHSLCSANKLWCTIVLCFVDIVRSNVLHYVNVLVLWVTTLLLCRLSVCLLVVGDDSEAVSC